MTGNARDLLAAALRVAGVGAVYGDRIDGVDVVPVATATVAALLARTHPRVTGDVALHAVGRSLTRPGGTPRSVRITTAADLVDLPTVLAEPGAHVELDLDLAAPAGDVVHEPPPAVDRWAAPPDEIVAAIQAAEAPMVLAGPGVVQAGAVPGLHALAAAGKLGVLNTWGAKGVFDWRSRHHLATAGLQARDFELGGLAESDLVIATGVDPDEAPPEQWAHRPHVVVDPLALDQLAEHVTPVADWLPVPELRRRLAAVTQAGWADTSAPLAPTAATKNYGTVLGATGRVVADPGVAGFWVARTFSTVRLGSAIVPAEREPGFALAAALVARRHDPHRPALAVVDEVPPEHRAILEVADALGAGFGVEAWQEAGEVLDPEQHEARLRRLATTSRAEVATLATGSWQREQIEDAAGPVTAWGGVASG